MTFIEFVRSQPSQPDARIQAFLDFAKKDVNFPSSGDPSVLAIYLYKKLDHLSTRAFQNLLMIYSKMPDNELPAMCFGRADMMLAAINLIVGLQNFDSEYAFKN